MAVEPINSRVYVGGLGDQATLQNLEELFKDFKPYHDLSLLRGFGFIQFHDEQAAQKAIKAMNGKVFKGRKLTVKIANDNRAKKGLLPRGGGSYAAGAGLRDRSPIDAAAIHARAADAYAHALAKRGYLGQPYSVADLSSVYPETTIGQGPHRGAESNDCEIIVVTKELTAYAEGIEARLKRAGMTVDLLFPNNDVPIGKVLANRASQGTFYCIVITPENQERNSITVNVLYGIPAEHRNMPTDDAVNFIIKNFTEKQRQERAKLQGLPYSGHMTGSAAQPATVQPLEVHSVPATQDKHPEAVQNMINLLAANRPLTVLQYERLIKYLTERKETQIRLELGDDVDTTTASSLIPPIITPAAAPVKSKIETERELQKKILDIINKPSIIGFGKPSSTFDNVPSEGQISSANLPTSSLLHDTKVQRALDTLLQNRLGNFNYY